VTAQARYRAFARTCLLEAERTDNPKFEKSLIATAKLYLRTAAAMKAAEAATAASDTASLIADTRMVAEPQAVPAAN
jgi:hypothetical protein